MPMNKNESPRIRFITIEKLSYRQQRMKFFCHRNLERSHPGLPSLVSPVEEMCAPWIYPVHLEQKSYSTLLDEFRTDRPFYIRVESRVLYRLLQKFPILNH
ncbi:hypothetical protein CEXT_453681 [Caerostris extrusa]|uniref:Uncharacterized protein n=1 Tax=Caerostris extrusa TaxID=172846 RepID=A0AAV4TJM9_CAEEX|nr:hypothetical protein CEXT_453681 [Caerostris extrusa]